MVVLLPPVLSPADLRITREKRREKTKQSTDEMRAESNIDIFFASCVVNRIFFRELCAESNIFFASCVLHRIFFCELCAESNIFFASCVLNRVYFSRGVC